jgi:Outer membrane protein transport protein (OMPP1/FadL/TodX)
MRILVSFIILSIFATSSMAQNFFYSSLFTMSPTVYDARSHALGKCEIMGATGSNAIFSNPAHIADQKRSMVQIGGAFWTEGFEKTLYDLPDYSDINYSNSSNSILELTQFSYSNRYENLEDDVAMSWGIGLNKFLNFSENLTEKRDSIENDSYTERSHDISGGLYFLTPSIAFHMNEKLKIGLTFNKSVYSKTKYSTDDISSSNSNPGSRTSIEGDQDVEASFISIGALYPVTKKLTLGFIYRGGMNIENSERIFDRTQTYDGSTVSEADTSAGHDIRVPAVTGFGATYKIIDNITLFGEYQTRNWSDYELDDYKWTFVDPGNCIRAGVETTLDNLALRIGYFSDSLPLTNSENENGFNDGHPLKHSGITTGFGLNLGHTVLEISGEYSWLKQELVYNQWGNDEDDLKYEESRTKFGVYASLTYFIE